MSHSRKTIFGLLTVFLIGLCISSLTLAYVHASPSDSVHSCKEMEQQVIEECATAFEDSYYYGGMNGKDMDFQKLKDSNRCQSMGSNMYWYCKKL